MLKQGIDFVIRGFRSGYALGLGECIRNGDDETGNLLIVSRIGEDRQHWLWMATFWRERAMAAQAERGAV
jgi:hypothetical protein